MRDARGRTAFSIACEFGYLKMCKFLYRMGSSLLTRSYGEKYTPLMLAMHQNQWNIVEWFATLDHYPDSNCSITYNLIQNNPKILDVIQNGIKKRNIKICNQIKKEMELIFLSLSIPIVLLGIIQDYLPEEEFNWIVPDEIKKRSELNYCGNDIGKNVIRYEHFLFPWQ